MEIILTFPDSQADAILDVTASADDRSEAAVGKWLTTILATAVAQHQARAAAQASIAEAKASAAKAFGVEIPEPQRPGRQR